MRSRDLSSAARSSADRDHLTREQPQHPSLTGDPRSASVILAAGRGLKTVPCFEKMLTLADAFCAQAVGTRCVLDLGWLPHEREVGLSGLRLQPRIYLGFGVSGTNFHTIGMHRSEWILAVNTDPTARIFRLADMCVRTDAGAFLDHLIENLPEEPFSSPEEIQTYVTQQAEKFPHSYNSQRRND